MLRHNQIIRRLERRLFVGLAWVCLVGIASAEPTAGEREYLKFAETYCLRCHNLNKQEGKFRLDSMPRDFKDISVAQRWGEVLFRINAGEMPPKDQPQPTAEEVGRVAEWISTRIREGEAVRMANRGPVAHYRLSREEYGHTVYDLLGVHFDVYAPGAFNDDPRWHGFERIGSMLSLSPSHIDRYIKAAEAVLERAFPEQQPAAVKGRRDAISLAGRDHHRKWLQDRGIAEKVRLDCWPGFVGHHIHTNSGGVPMRVRLQLSGLQTRSGKAPHLTIWDFVLKKSIFDEDIVGAEDKPIVVEFVTTSSSFQIMNEVTGKIPDGHTKNVLNSGQHFFISTRESRYLEPTGYKLIDDEGAAIYPLMLIDWLEWESVPTSESDLQKRQGLIPAKDGDRKEVADCLQRLATRAWRRPATEAEISRYMSVIEQEQGAGESFRAAYRAAMVGVLTSKNFYYLEEGSPTERRDKINDWELASRLSYFLWSSMPDEDLFAAARAGTLHQPDVLRAQIARMLNDAKVSRFTESFPRQWLQLHKVGMFPPDAGLYPDYDKWLELSMVLETTGYFEEMFKSNLPLQDFLRSDWTLVNPRLALHYGLPPLTQSGFQRVTLDAGAHRGGLLTQASILMLTSDGTRHRPVHRGVWVSEAIFGKTPPPPPPNVEPLEPTPVNKPKATVRMQLEAHATHSTCASCHRKIDPLGFAFDNYDAIGRWRTEERVPAGQGANPLVNASGSLADGRTFQNAEEFKQLLIQDVDKFAEAFVEQLATYGLRRAMTVDDAQQIHAITTASKRQDFRFRSVIENFVLSDLFQKR